MNTEIQLRLKNEAHKIGIVLGVLVIYGIYCCFSKIRIPCVFHLVTGLLCPGCGMTRAAVALMHFDLKAAWNYNMLSLTVVPILLFVMLLGEIRYIIKGERRTTVIETVILCILMLITVLYGIVRNIAILGG